VSQFIKFQQGEKLKLVEALHASERRLTNLVSLQEIQTLGRKKFRAEDFDPAKFKADRSGDVSVKSLGKNHISSLVQKRKREDEENTVKKKRINDPRIVVRNQINPNKCTYTFFFSY